MKRIVSVMVVMIICAMAAPALSEVPEYVAKKTGCPMAMDGILNEPAWQKAAPVGPFVFQWYESGEKEMTEAKILWDDERIYFAFKCDDKYVWAEHFIHNTAVFRDDCCEAFISPVPEGPERLDYINYEINCIGSWLAGYHAKSRGEDRSWKDCSGLEIGRYINGTCSKDDDVDEGWVLEFSVPFKHFEKFAATFPPKNGQVIYLGLNRLGGQTNFQYSQWSPSQTEKPNFHSPKDFGKVTFSTEVLK